MTMSNPIPFSGHWDSIKQAARQHRWSEVRALLDECEALSQFASLGLAERTSFDQMLSDWRLCSAPWWWEPVRTDGLQLRRTQASDAEFYRSCYNDPGFAQRFNRQSPWVGDLATALLNSGGGSPVVRHDIQWVACADSGEPLGLVSLSGLDLVNLKAEFAIGSTGSLSKIQAIKAMLLALHFAFFVLGLNKLYSYHYEENPESLDQIRRMGFQLEGHLTDQFRLPKYGFVSVNLTGLSLRQLRADKRLCALARRWLGVDWQSLPAPPRGGVAVAGR